MTTAARAPGTRSWWSPGSASPNGVSRAPASPTSPTRSGIRPPSLFHHFPSKVALYRAVLLDAFDDWFALMDDTAAAEAAEGWPQVERVIRTAFRFFVERPDFVRLARWEALEGGSVLVEELAMVLRPLFERGAASSRARWTPAASAAATPAAS